MGVCASQVFTLCPKHTQNNLQTKFVFVRVIDRSVKVSSSAKLLNLQPSKDGEEYRYGDENKLISNITAIWAELLGDRRDILSQNSQQ